MIILSHRGYWKTPEEKNSVTAFKRSFDLGFGLETDLRDLDGEIVVSHDMPLKKSGPISLREFLDLYVKACPKRDLILALNIKADGLAGPLKKILAEYAISQYFTFDMSVPDALVTLNEGVKTYTRQSEFESPPSFYTEAEGIWMDEFKSHWITREDIEAHLKRGKKVALVSPELHRRPHEAVWQEYKGILRDLKPDEKGRVLLCTDFPEDARKFFNEQD